MLFALAGLLPAAALAQVAAVPGAVDFTHTPASPGSWSYRPFAGGSDAWFMDTTGTIRLFIRCNRPSRTVTVSRTGSAPAASLNIWTTSGQRTLPARFEPNLMRVTATLAAADPLLDAIAFSRGRIALSMPGYAPLVVNAGPEAARAFEDCRN